MNRFTKFNFAKYGAAKFIAREKRAPYGRLRCHLWSAIALDASSYFLVLLAFTTYSCLKNCLSDSFSVLLTTEHLMRDIGLITDCVGVVSDPCWIWGCRRNTCRYTALHFMYNTCTCTFVYPQPVGSFWL